MKIFITLLSFLLPSISFAQSLNKISTVNGLVTRILAIGDLVLYLLVALAVIFIVWTVVIYLIKPSDSADRKTAGLNILWGIVGLFIILSLWGLVNILINTFYTDPNVSRDRFPNANFLGSGSNTSPTGTTNNFQNVPVKDEPYTDFNDPAFKSDPI